MGPRDTSGVGRGLLANAKGVPARPSAPVHRERVAGSPAGDRRSTGRAQRHERFPEPLREALGRSVDVRADGANREADDGLRRMRMPVSDETAIVIGLNLAVPGFVWNLHRELVDLRAEIRDVL